jgi:hypothetical protein
MKILLTIALLAISSSAFASSYTCENGMSLNVEGTGAQAKITLKSPMMSGDLTVLDANSKPGFLMIGGELTSPMYPGQTIHGALLIETSLANQGDTGKVLTFTGEGWATSNCVKNN